MDLMVIFQDNHRSQKRGGGYAGDLTTPAIYVGGYWYVYPPP